MVKSFYYTSESKATITSPALNKVYWTVRLTLTAYLLYVVYESDESFEKVEPLSFSSIEVFGGLRFDQSPDVIDAHDLTHDSALNNSAFVPTEAYITTGQQKTKVTGFATKEQKPLYCASTVSTTKCEQPRVSSFELLTGSKSDKNYCESQSWCPVANTVSERAKLYGLNSLSFALKRSLVFRLATRSVVKQITVHRTLAELYSRVNNSAIAFDSESDFFEPVVLHVDFATVCYPYFGCKDSEQVVRLDSVKLDNKKNLPIYTKFLFSELKTNNVDGENDQNNYNAFRDLYAFRGVQIVVGSSGYYADFQASRFLMTIGSAVAYTTFANFVLDFLLWLLKGGYVYENLKYKGRNEDEQKLVIKVNKMIDIILEKKKLDCWTA